MQIEDTEEIIKYVHCPDCGGSGQQMVAKLYPTGHTECWEYCDLCSGDGQIEEGEFLIMKLKGQY